MGEWLLKYRKPFSTIFVSFFGSSTFMVADLGSVQITDIDVEFDDVIFTKTAFGSPIRYKYIFYIIIYNTYANNINIYWRKLTLFGTLPKR